MIIDELNKKIADIESLANDKTSTIESKVSDLTDGLLMVADAVDIIPEMVDEKITAITKEFSTIKEAVSKVKAQKGDKGDRGEPGIDGIGIKGNDGKDGSPDTGEQIASKLNELEGVIDTKVLKDFNIPDVSNLQNQINTIGNQTLRLLSRPTSTSTGSTFTGVTTDATLTGVGTEDSPLSVVATSASDVAVTVRAATTATLAGTWTYNNGTAGVGATLTRTTNGVLPNQDGVSLSDGDRFLIKNQASTLVNGVYVLTQKGVTSVSPTIFTRATDADTTSELDELVVTVSEGSTNRGTVWGQQTNNPIIGTSAITFATVVSTAVTQATSGTQAIYQIPTLTGTARQITRGTANFKYNPTNDLFTIRGIDYTFPANNGDASQVLTTDGSGTLSWTTPSGGGTPAGSDTQIQYNNAGAFGADSGFTRDVAGGSTTILNTTDFGGGETIDGGITTTGGITTIEQIYSASAVPLYGARLRIDGTENAVNLITENNISGDTNGFYAKGGMTVVGNYFGGNGTKITIDDVNKTIALIADGNTAYSSDIPLSAKVTVSPIDMLAVVTGPTPYQLIAAPGAGKFIEVISTACYVNFNTTPYDFDDLLRIGTNTTGSTTIGTDGGQVTTSPIDSINVSSSKLSVVRSQSGEKNINTALYLNAGNATSVTQGDSDVTFYITYKIVTL